MHSLKISDFAEFIRHVAIRNREPVIGWGQPGVGKTKVLEQIAREDGMVLVDCRLGQYDSVDLRGFPAVDQITNTTVWHAPSTLPFKDNPHFDDDKPIMLVFDEINGGKPDVMGVAMQIINERRCGEHKLRDNVHMVALANRESDKGVTNRMPLTLTNRLTHVGVEVDKDDWCAWAQTIGNMPMVAVGFYQFRPALLNTFDPKKPDKVFATPRTSEKAWHYYADEQMPSAIKHAAMAGVVGDGVAAEMWAFIQVWQQIKTYMPRILKDPTTVELPGEPSMQYAVATAVSGSMNASNCGTYHLFLKRMPPEFCVLAWNLAVQRDKGLFATTEFVAFSKQFRAIFDN